jgi:ATP-dependent RNA helicase DeaD
VAFPQTHAPFARALNERSYSEPTEVQAAVLASAAADRDLLVSAQTGSGKTVAFGLAIGATLLGAKETLGPIGEPLALIIAPTRELALQVQRELQWLYEHTGALIVACVGGMDPLTERRALNRGCHIVVGTPGRLRDHLDRGSLRLASLKAVVLDEADEMLDLGFREDLEHILKATPQGRRTLLFSATLPKAIVSLAKQFQRDALRIAASVGQRGHADIEYRVVRIAPQDTEHAVVNLLRFFESPSALVFCNTRDAVRHLHATLLERGFSSVSLSGELTQAERNRALQALRDGKARVCVATDVAARGIDLPNLGLVIHADLPNDAQVLQHRSGRTGRAGQKGVSVLLVQPSRRRRAEQLLASADASPKWGNAPTAADITQRDDERFLQRLLQVEPAQPEDLVLARKLLEQRSPEEIASILVRFHRAQLPAPEDIVEQNAAPSTAPPYKNSSHKSASPRASSGPRDAEGPMVWFSLNVGRAKKADPKWLIPEICRQGGITKREIGAIRIFDDETKFEIVTHAADQFSERVGKLTKAEMKIVPGDAPIDQRPYAGNKPWQGKFAKKPAHGNHEKPGKSAYKPHKPNKSAKGKPHKQKAR